MGTDPDNITQPVEPEYRAYQYDPIGNRAQITEAANTGGYTANNLNQYTGQTVPGDGARSFDYDADGNLISLIENGSEKVYTWNAENRLTSVAPRTPANGDKKVEFVYDYMGRRIKKSVYAYNSDSWLLTSEFFFIYDGWNLVEEIAEIGAAQTSRYFVWGQDLSQSLQGAGGIGGLIATVDGAADYHLYCFDANGNVGQVVNAADGAIAAKYEYDPYGKPIKADGAYAADNPFRFSTKYHDDETGLVYYGYRYYSPELGRWLSRDPINNVKIINNNNLYISIDKKDEFNQYVFNINNALIYFDYLGLRSLRFAEREALRVYFGDAINLDVIDIDKSTGDRAYSIYENDIRLPEKFFINQDPCKELRLDSPYVYSVFAHEALHVYQRQGGQWVTLKAFFPQVGLFLNIYDPYGYDKSETDAEKLLNAFKSSSVEQQGAIFEDMVYAIQRGVGYEKFLKVYEHIYDVSKSKGLPY